MTRAIDRMLWPSALAATLLFVGWGTGARAPRLFSTVLSPARLIAVAAIVKLILLAPRCPLELAGAPDRSTPTIPSGPPGPCWPRASSATLIGQAALARYQLIGQQSPFPSAGDVFYLLAYPLVGAALVRFVGRVPPGRLSDGNRGPSEADCSR